MPSGHWLSIIIIIKGNCFWLYYNLITQFQCINYYIIFFFISLTSAQHLAFPLKKLLTKKYFHHRWWQWVGTAVMGLKELIGFGVLKEWWWRFDELYGFDDQAVMGLLQFDGVFFRRRAVRWVWRRIRGVPWFSVMGLEVRWKRIRSWDLFLFYFLIFLIFQFI